jgi:hypothetical protein
VSRAHRGLSASSNSHLVDTRGYQVGPIVQTLTLAIILLVIGLTCMVLGITGLMWKAGWDRRRKEKAANALTTGELSPLANPAARHR